MLCESRDHDVAEKRWFAAVVDHVVGAGILISFANKSPVVDLAAIAVDVTRIVTETVGYAAAVTAGTVCG